jgi:formylglycine-generating enzyme required for sulfatase activity
VKVFIALFATLLWAAALSVRAQEADAAHAVWYVRLGLQRSALSAGQARKMDEFAARLEAAPDADAMLQEIVLRESDDEGRAPDAALADGTSWFRKTPDGRRLTDAGLRAVPGIVLKEPAAAARPGSETRVEAARLDALLIAAATPNFDGASSAANAADLPAPSPLAAMKPAGNAPDDDFQELFPGPRTPAAFPSWLAGMNAWREETRKALLADGIDLEAIEKKPEFSWTQADFVQPQLMAHDRYFYDPVRARFTVERYLSDLETRYGKIDSVLLWPTYPNIGVDDRNQYDLIRDLPGGIPALRKVIRQFHRRGVRVLLPLSPWDNGTRDEGVSHAAAIARLLAETGADGFNGDTMTAPEKAYFDAGTAASHPIAIEPEYGFGEDFAALSWTPLSWGEGYRYEEIPGVDRYKWLETRHRTHMCNRWSQDRNDDLQHAWFNGDGYESWENVWGVWNGISPRDGAAIKRISTISRAYSKLLVSPDWEPHTPTLQDGVYASRFRLASRTIWTVVNRTAENKSGPILAVPYHGETFYDLWNGAVLAPGVHGSTATLSFPVEDRGFGAVLAAAGPPDAELSTLLRRLRALAKTPLSDLSSTWTPLPQRITPIADTRPAHAPPPRMISIPENAHFEFKVSGVEIEPGPEDGVKDGVDVQYPWEDKASAAHDQTLSIPSFFIDRENVSNQEFARFLKAARYSPADAHHFLADWPDWKKGIFPQGRALSPVTWVSLEDARAYAAWAHKRLPHEWEWQYAAQGTDARLYPWGNAWNPDAAPKPETDRMRPRPDQGGKAAGASPFGVLDMVGTVWQWTDEFSDAHTRAAILRGGSSYQPQGSKWYFPQAYRLDQHGKYLLMAPSIDRSGMIGFRCAADKK